MQIGIRKNKNSNNKQNKIITALVIGIVAVSIFIAVMIGNNIGKDKTETTTDPTAEVTETLGDIVIDDEISSDNKGTQSTTQKAVEVIKPAEPETTTQKQISTTNQKAETVKPATPVTQKQNPGSQGGFTEIIDSGNDPVKEYSCGVSKHHCDSKETHDFIVSLEKKGCPYCGSHSCKSFYTVDEWGNSCYDATRCESYSEKNDPCEYCQECGKKCGTGSNGTCVRFTVDTKCPECGKKVSAKTCHSH